MTVKELQEITARHEKILAYNTATLEQILATLAKLTRNESSSSSTPNVQQQTNIQGRPIRLDFPRFDGEDPEGWLFQAEQFFNLNPMPTTQRVTMAAIHLEGDSVAWYRWLHKYMGELTWLQFSTALCKRFGSRKNVDPTNDSSTSHTSRVHEVHELKTFVSEPRQIDDMSSIVDIAASIQDVLQEMKLFREKQAKETQHLLHNVCDFKTFVQTSVQEETKALVSIELEASIENYIMISSNITTIYHKTIHATKLTTNQVKIGFTSNKTNKLFMRHLKFKILVKEWRHSQLRFCRVNMIWDPGGLSSQLLVSYNLEDRVDLKREELIRVPLFKACGQASHSRARGCWEPSPNYYLSMLSLLISYYLILLVAIFI